MTYRGRRTQGAGVLPAVLVVGGPQAHRSIATATIIVIVITIVVIIVVIVIVVGGFVFVVVVIVLARAGVGARRAGGRGCCRLRG